MKLLTLVFLLVAGQASASVGQGIYCQGVGMDLTATIKSSTELTDLTTFHYYKGMVQKYAWGSRNLPKANPNQATEFDQVLLSQGAAQEYLLIASGALSAIVDAGSEDIRTSSYKKYSFKTQWVVSDIDSPENKYTDLFCYPSSN
ncbi:MAG: hypothetical protein ACXWC9_01040 [Pseudobdellovibrionaceae bacterium]